LGVTALLRVFIYDVPEMENKMKRMLSPFGEDFELHDSEAVAAEMRRQWEAVSARSAEEWGSDDRMSHIGERVKRSVSRHISGRYASEALRRWRRYGIAASIALALALGAGVGLYSGMSAKWGIDHYVYHSGNQDKKAITLGDGTVVTLGARSKIVYPERFRGRERRVEIEGQAYFRVAKDEESTFVVNTRDLEVVVLGTEFEVFENEGQSYTEVILAQGSARVDYRVGESRKSYTMRPDEKLVYTRDDCSVKVASENARLYTAWKDNDGLTFVRERLSNILPRLEKWFGCSIVCTSPEILEETFTFRVRNESPEVIFDHMDRTLDIEYTLDRLNNVYTIEIPR
jgi:ferric-dicitrate binding protein FerR (iron transport regulator)